MNRPENGTWPEPDTYPGVVRGRGGWFAVTEPHQLGSGPWPTREQAEARLPKKEPTMTRKTFEMTEEQFQTLLEAGKSVPLIALQCGTPRSAQENANEAWKKLADEMGFVWDSARPVNNNPRLFSADVAAPAQPEREVLADVTVDDGKYRFVYYTDGKHPEAYRHGERWMVREDSMVGDKAFMALCCELAEARASK